MPQGLPADGDDLLFGGAPPRTSSVFDMARNFSSLTFSTDSSMFLMRVLGGSWSAGALGGRSTSAD